MIMPVGQRLLLPANPAFIWGSLVLAFFLNMFFNMAFFGRAAWAPDLVAIVLVFWTVHQTSRVGIGAAFVFGLLMDVHHGSLLGQHALSYIILSYFAITIHRRMLWFGLRGQAVQILTAALNYWNGQYFAAQVIYNAGQLHLWEKPTPRPVLHAL
jgi:rod shape-determining protein MreD